MRIIRWRAIGKRPAAPLSATFLLLLLFTADGLLSNPRTSSLSRSKHVAHQILNPTIQSRPVVKCESKRDPLLESDTEEEDYNIVEIEGNTERKRLQESQVPTSMPPQSLSIQAGFLATLLFVAFWPLLALLRSTTSPIDGFDVDMFMALKGIMDTPPLMDTDSTIVELPSLSPAEQLVGAIFGPPH